MGLDAPSGVPTSPGSSGLSGGLKGELESLKDFKKRVDDILKDLDSSPAAPAKVSQQEVGRSSFGGNFTEADDIYAEYNRVHSHLTRLSRVFGAQIEAMGIAVHGADVGFGNLEDDVKRRFWQIQNEAHEFQRETEQPEQQPKQRPEADDREATY